MSVLTRKLLAPSGTPPSPDINPPFQKVALLLHGDGTNGAQNNTFVDSSTNNFTITRTGNVAQGTFSPFSLAEGQWSNYFDGSGDYLGLPASSSLSLTGDFTIEFWAYPTSPSTQQQIWCPSSGADRTIGKQSNNTWTYYDGSNQNVFGSVNSNSWQHIALTRSGSTISGYKNGVLGFSVSDTATLEFSAGAIGYRQRSPAGFYFTGNLSNFRIVKGTAVYTSNFTPSTTPLTAVSGTSLLTCQSNRFNDNSSNNFTITRNGDTKVTAFSPFAPSAAYDASTNGGSAYFDGSGDYLALASNTALTLSSDFTIEAWINTSTKVNYQSICSSYGSVSTTGFFLLTNSSGTVTAGVNGTSFINGTVNVCNGAWNHIAYVRSSGVTKLYINGALDGTLTSTDIASSTDGVYIGSEPGTFITRYFNGHISNLRIVKGTALYTTTFTPPTAPLTAVANTQLLLNCVNAGIFDNAGKNDIETVGNAKVSTSVKKYGTGSMYFDGTGDRLYSAFNGDIGSGDFTLEAWIYPTTINNTHGILATSNINTGSWVFGLNSSGNLRWFANATSNTVNLNEWNHIVACRASGSIRLFINGILGATISDTTNYFQSPFVIGTERSLTIDYFGYIDDIRITKGQALYTSNFTPPTQAFPNV